MSAYHPQHPQQPYQPQPIYIEQSNGLAVAGLVFSVLGLLTAGILSPIGLILSLVALGKPVGKGMAWSGVIFGFLGLCGWGAAIILIVVGAIAAVGGAAFGVAMTHPEAAEVSRDMLTIAAQIEQYEDDHGGIGPANLDMLKLGIPTRLDPWGNDYRYMLTDKTKMGYDLISNGADGVPDTEDDIQLSNLDDHLSEIFEGLEVDMNRIERGEDPTYERSGGRSDDGPSPGDG